MRQLVALVFCLTAASAQQGFNPQQVLKDAVEAQQSGRIDDAIRGYRLLLEKYPQIPEIHSNMGAALASQGDYIGAIAEYRKALALRPDPQVELNAALAHYKGGEIAAAVPLLQHVLATMPSHRQAQLLLADCYLQLGNNKQVIGLLTPVEQAEPGNAAVTYLLGTALIRDGQTARGQVIIDRILKNGETAEAHLLMGSTKFMVKDFAGALKDFQRAVELNPRLPDLFSYYGQALLMTGDQAAAHKAFERELQSNPNNFDSNLRLGMLLRGDNDNARALNYLRQALRVRPGDPGVRYQIAAIELAQNNIAAAERDLVSLTRDSPQFLEAHVSLATVYFRQKRKADGQRERAIVAQLNATQQATAELATTSSDPAQEALRLGNANFDAGNFPEAVHQFAQAASANPGLGGLQSRYGTALLYTGDPTAAISAFQKAIDRDANDPDANAGLGEIYAERKQYQQAEPYLRRALQSKPGDFSVTLALAQSLAGQQQFTAALPYAQQAVASKADSALAHAALADIYTGLHRPADVAREQAAAAHLQSTAFTADLAPPPGSLAPDFTLAEAGSGKSVRLSDFRGKSPVLLLFGSYSCPNFRDAAPALLQLQQQFGAQLPTLLVYVHEAHAGMSWQSTRNQRDRVSIAEPSNLAAKDQNAQTCRRGLHLPFPALVDGMDRRVETLYNAWPSRAFLIGIDGRVLYSTRLTELDFHPDRLNAAVLQALGPARVSRN